METNIMSYFNIVCVTGRRNDPLSMQWNFTAICYCKTYMRNQKTRNLAEILIFIYLAMKNFKRSDMY
jgi:hypothetical protein